MFKVLRPSKDAYITDRVIDGVRQTSANVGGGGSLDLFKVYGFTHTLSGTTKLPNTELSRLLVKFDLEPLRELVAAGKIDPQNPSFNCKLYLHDVYGGQPSPDNFTIEVHPLSASFDEGLGRDVVFYSDSDTCNWLTGSVARGAWFVTGCGLGGDDSVPSDYLTASKGISLRSTQAFVTGEEDLNLDVTAAISATLAGLVPDEGFRISFPAALEVDTHTYFVKRFASRTAWNDDLRPKLIVRYDDSIQDDTNNMYLDSAGCMFLRNYVRNVRTNLISGSTTVTGSNCLILQLVTPVSGGTYSLYFTGSQHYSGRNPQTGIYSASVTVTSTDSTLRTHWQHSGSVTFTPIWRSFDGTVAYLTGSSFKVYLPQRGAASLDPKRYEVTVTGVRDRLKSDEQTILRVDVFDRSSPLLTTPVRVPVNTPGTVVRDVHYQVRDAVSKRVVIPFDTAYNSTRVSNDSTGMYFKLDASNLTGGRTYVIDVLVVSGDNEEYHEAVSPAFRVGDTA
mgnify:CR=1 FL=1